jgi:uncharacterized ferredoxin-like protein
MVFWRCNAFSACAGIVGREDTANKTNNSQAMLAIVARGINVPPAIAIARYLGIKARSLNTASAARIPARAAIGTPGPG